MLWRTLGEGWHPQFWLSPLGAVPGVVYFLADLANPSQRLIVEIDGRDHCGAKLLKDVIREEWLVSQGWTVLRFTNKEVRSSLASVAEKIRSHCTT
jgi:very-short-patch-repair endonuclease